MFIRCLERVLRFALGFGMVPAGGANDPYDLQRFLDAQASVFDSARRELQQGRKRGHWMWFVFPQLKGLGRSPMAQEFGISSREEAQAYLDHPVLGQRLRESVRLVLAIEGRSVTQIFGYPDDLKFRSSMTLFAAVAGDDRLFDDALRKYCGGEPDPLTLARL
jgi:uncharacterized protein (DUF1810 family)